MLDPKTLTTNKEWEKIVSMLIRAYIDGAKVSFWQTQSKTDRINYTGNIIDVDKKNNRITINIVVKEELTLYILYNEQQILFKANVIEVDTKNNLTILEIPDHMGVPKDLVNFHYYFLETDKKKIKINTQDPTTMRPFEKTFLMIELHNFGAQFVVEGKDPKEIKVFPDGHTVHVKFITDQKYGNNIDASVLMSARYNKHYLVSIEFLQELKKITYANEFKSVNLKESAPKNLGSGGHEFEKSDIYNQIKLRDPKLATNILENVDYLDKKIRFMSANMKSSFLRQVDLKKLAYCLRLSQPDLVELFLKDTSKTIKEEINHHINTTLKATEIAAYQKEIIDFLREKETMGQFVMEEDKDVLV